MHNGASKEMRITTKGRYGLRAVINLAGAQHARPISIGSIANEEKVSSEFLEQIFFKLKKAGLIRSVRGPGGGFVLNKKPSEISVQNILEAVGEARGLVPCTLQKKLCDREEACAAHDIWTGLQKTMEDYLSHVTLKDILEKNGAHYSTNLAAGQDFSI
jgi:Rrf2 family transcriptional regulator, iron-sulfur cluster assembly transcription factor